MVKYIIRNGTVSGCTKKWVNTFLSHVAFMRVSSNSLVSRKGKNEGKREERRKKKNVSLRCLGVSRRQSVLKTGVFNYSVHAVIQEMRPCKIKKVCVCLQTPSMRGQRSGMAIIPLTYRWTYIIPLETFVQSRCGKIN